MATPSGVFLSKPRLAVITLLIGINAALAIYGLSNSFTNQRPDFSRSSLKSIESGKTFSDKFEDSNKTFARFLLAARNTGADSSMEDFHVSVEPVNGARVEGRIFNGNKGNPNEAFTLSGPLQIVSIAHSMIGYIIVDAIFDDIPLSEIQRAGTKFTINFKDVVGTQYSFDRISDGTIHTNGN